MTEPARLIRPDGRQSETAAGLQRGVARLLRDRGLAPVYELTLASGRRVDVMAVSAAGEITIIEIKSSLADFRADDKWHDYLAFCDRFYFAIPESLDPGVMPAEAGLIIADRFGAEVMRDSLATPLSAARRKMLLIDFARCAALRLHTLHDPDS